MFSKAEINFLYWFLITSNDSPKNNEKNKTIFCEAVNFNEDNYFEVINKLRRLKNGR